MVGRELISVSVKSHLRFTNVDGIDQSTGVMQHQHCLERPLDLAGRVKSGRELLRISTTRLPGLRQM